MEQCSTPSPWELPPGSCFSAAGPAMCCTACPPSSCTLWLQALLESPGLCVPESPDRSGKPSECEREAVHFSQCLLYLGGRSSHFRPCCHQSFLFCDESARPDPAPAKANGKLPLLPSRREFSPNSLKFGAKQNPRKPQEEMKIQNLRLFLSLPYRNTQTRILASSSQPHYPEVSQSPEGPGAHRAAMPLPALG